MAGGVHMNAVKESINKLFLKNKGEDKSIGSFFLYYEDNLEITDPILYLLYEVCIMDYRSKIPELNAQEIELLKEGKQYLRGIKSYEAFFDFLIMCNTKESSPFLDDFNKLIDSFFSLKSKKLSEINDIILLLDFAITYSEQFGEQFIRKIFKYFIAQNSSVGNVIILNSIIERYGVDKIKRFKNINLVFDSLLKTESISFRDSHQYILLAEYCVLYNKNSKESKIKYINIILQILPDLNDPHLQGKVQKCRDYIKDTNYGVDKLLDVEHQIELMGQKASNLMQEIKIPLPTDAINKLDNLTSKRLEILGKMSNLDKLKWYIVEVHPFTKTELLEFEKGIEEKSIFAKFCKTIYYDNKKEVINYVDLSKDDEETLKCRSGFHVLTEFLEFTVCRPFYKSFVLDKEVERYIVNFSKNNKMIDSKNGWDLKFVNYFSDLLNSKTDDLIQKVLPLFENSLRYYFKNEGLYTRKSNSNDFINLGDVFNGFDKPNRFRDKLLETIDEDYYWMLCYLLTNRLGFNARNANLHGVDDPNFSRSFTAYYACVLIFRLYIAFYVG